MPTRNPAAAVLAQLIEGTSAGALIPEQVRQGLQSLIEAQETAEKPSDDLPRVLSAVQKAHEHWVAGWQRGGQTWPRQVFQQSPSLTSLK